MHTLASNVASAQGRFAFCRQSPVRHLRFSISDRRILVAPPPTDSGGQRCKQTVHQWFEAAGPAICRHAPTMLAPTAGAPREAAGATAPSAAATAAKTTTPAASATASATAAAPATATTSSGKLHAALPHTGAFLVEHIEGREIDVGEFFFAKDDCLIGRNVRSRRGGCRRSNGCGRSASCEQGQPSGPQNWHGFIRRLSLRRLLRTWHSEFLHA
jgi:hypothetical protein